MPVSPWVVGRTAAVGGPHLLILIPATHPRHMFKPAGSATFSGMEVFVEAGFESAHYLPSVPAGHKCSRMHGHSFRLRISVSGPPDPITGWVMDFAEIREAIQPVVTELDHRVLNEIAGLENPTSENLSRWIWLRLQGVLPGLSAVEVRETRNSGCIYRGG